MEYTIDQLLEMLPQAFISDKAAGVDFDAQLHLSGEGGGDYAIAIHDQRLVVTPGRAANADVTVNASAQDMVEIANRRMDPMRAFMSGKVKVSGDLRKAMSLVSLFRMPF